MIKVIFISKQWLLYIAIHKDSYTFRGVFARVYTPAYLRCGFIVLKILTRKYQVDNLAEQ